MVFEKFKEKTKQLKDISDHVKDVSLDKVNQLLDDFNNALPTIKTLGLSMKNFHIGMGVIPEIETTLSGSVDAIDIKKIQELIQDNPDKKILTSILKALQTAFSAKEKLGDLAFKSVEVVTKIGLPPKISVDFME